VCYVCFVHKSFSFTVVPCSFIKVNEGSVYVLFEHLCYIVHNHEANDNYLCRREVKDTGVDSKSHVCRSVVFKDPALCIPGWNPTRFLCIPEANFSQFSSWGGNTQSPFLSTSVHFLRK